MTALSPVGGQWGPHRRASALAERRERLLTRLPHRITAAAGLSTDVRELIVDDAIEFTALAYKPAIGSGAELERVFWDAAAKRVKRARTGRYDIVRAGYQRADLAALDTLGVKAPPENETLARAELSASLHFAALLEPGERDVFRCQLDGPRDKPLGAKKIARALDRPLGEVRNAERAIEIKYERFATIYAAGRLCGYLAPAVAALAAGDDDAHSADSGRELAARVHLEVERCPTCTADYTRHLRYLQGARFHHQVAALLPASASSERIRGLGGGARDWLPDWAARLLAHEPAGSAAQLAAGGAARGAGTAVAIKLATFCLAGAGTLGACVATGVLPLDRTPEPPPASASPTPRPKPTPGKPEPRLPHGAAPTPTATPTPRPPRRRASSTRPTRSTGSTRSTQGGTGPRSHEQAPASPAPPNAAAGGASEFDPSYQPSAPAAPAPVPAAPGAIEFP